MIGRGKENNKCLLCMRIHRAAVCFAGKEKAPDIFPRLTKKDRKISSGKGKTAGHFPVEKGKTPEVFRALSGGRFP